MDILSYLSELIQTRKEVGIPGLGTLYKKKLPGRYDAETHSFLPPSYTLSFTEEVKEDVLLAEFISKKRNVSADTANYFIDEFSAALNKSLTADQQAELPGIGKLKQQNGQLIFVPAPGLNTGTDFFGLPPVKADMEPDLPLESEQEPYIKPSPDAEDAKPSLESVTADNEIAEENPGHESVSEVKINTVETAGSAAATKAQEEKQEEVIWQIKKTEPIVAAPFIKEEAQPAYIPEEEEQEKTTPLYLKILMVLLVIAIFIAGTYILKPELFTGITGNPNPELKTVKKPVEQSSPIVPADSASLTDSATAIVDTPAANNIPKTNTPAPAVKAPVVKAPVTTTADSTVTYEVIGAAVLNQKEVDYFIYQMKKSGITATALPKESGKRIKMSLGTFNDRASANVELEKLKTKLKIEGIYIYTNKQK